MDAGADQTLNRGFHYEGYNYGSKNAERTRYLTKNIKIIFCEIDNAFVLLNLTFISINKLCVQFTSTFFCLTIRQIFSSDFFSNFDCVNKICYLRLLIY